MNYQNFIKFIKETLAPSEIDLYSKQSPANLYGEIKDMLERNKGVFYDEINITGKISTNYIFELYRQNGLSVISVGGLADFGAHLKGTIQNTDFGSQIKVQIIPSSYLKLLFIAGLLSACVIILLTIFGMRAHDTFGVLSFALLIICPFSILFAYFSKENLLKSFIIAFDLEKNI